MSRNPLKITDVVLRDAHQSLLATRMRLDDLLPILDKLDKVGLWSAESWGGATFDSCIRFLGEDPWERLRQIKAAMPNTPQQMLFRGQNILGYRHYADDVVRKFVERAATNGIDVFRVFDAMNDPRNLETAIKAVVEVDKHAQGALSYTISPVHTTQMWVDLAVQIADMGATSICIKDMAGLLKPYTAYELVDKIKKATNLPVHLHAHATTGMSVATLLKACEAGVDMVDTAISSMSMTYGHSPTESMVAILQDTDRDTGLDLNLLEEISAYFREVRKKYHSFEGALQGADSRILVAQVPGGMLTNLEGQLKKQNAADKMDEVLAEIPKVREDLGFIPLVTPTSQIVGTQAVMNVLSGTRYQSISKETQGILKGEYGASPAPVNKELQARVLDGADPVTCRPADLLEPELDKLTSEVEKLARTEDFALSDAKIDDVLIYALFAKVGLKFLKNRNNPDVFEPVPGLKEDLPSRTTVTSGTNIEASPGASSSYRVRVGGKTYTVEVEPEGTISRLQETPSDRQPSALSSEAIPAPLAGDITRVAVSKGQNIGKGDLLLLLEAMKMETEVRSPRAGLVEDILVSEGDSVAVGDVLLSIG